MAGSYLKCGSSGVSCAAVAEVCPGVDCSGAFEVGVSGAGVAGSAAPGADSSLASGTEFPFLGTDFGGAMVLFSGEQSNSRSYSDG